MRPFEYIRATSLDAAASALKSDDVALLAGGTSLLDLMKINVMSPEKIIDINRIGLNEIDKFPAGNLLQKTRCPYYRDTASRQFELLAQRA